MVINIFATLFVLGLTFLNSLFGLYSGLINVFCCITGLCVSFGFGEAVNNLLTSNVEAIPPTYTEPLVYVALFLLTVAILRTLTDTFLRGNVRVPMYVDWVGGGICGFIIAQITVGVMMICFLMLPWGGRVAGYERFSRAEDDEIDPTTRLVKFEENPFWLRSADFTVGLFEALSAGSLKGNTEFAHVYPDFPEWVFFTGNQIQHESVTAPIRKKGDDGFKNGLRVESWWTQSTDLPKDITAYRQEKPGPEHIKRRRTRRYAAGSYVQNLPAYQFQRYEIQPEHELLGVRLRLMRAAADRVGKSPGRHRFRPTVIRLVGDVVYPSGRREPHQFIPRVVRGADPVFEDYWQIVNLDTNFSLPSTSTIDLLFEVPAGPGSQFEPRFLEYRRHARVPLPPAEKRDTPPTNRLAAQDAGESAGADRGRGASRFIDAIARRQSGGITDLPFPLSRSAVANAEVRGQELLSVPVGTIIAGSKSALQATPIEGITDLAEPAGLKIIQFQFKTSDMKSLAGQIMNFVGSVTNTYQAIDRNGRTFLLNGFYALVDRNDDKYLELFFTPRPEDVGYQNRLQGMSDATLRDVRQQDDARLGLIFLVPPDTCIAKIKVGNSEFEFGEEICVGSD